MLNHFKEFVNQLINEVNYRILWIELVLFSVILGVVPHLWPLACLIFLGLSYVLNKPKGMLHMIYILSFGWGAMIMIIAYFVSGWGWGTVWGVFALISSLVIHFRDLKHVSCNTAPIESGNTLDDNWYFKRQNLN